MEKEDFFTSLNVFDYPGPPDEPHGICECTGCGRQIFKGDYIMRSWEGDIYCDECLKNMRIQDIFDFLGKEYSPLLLLEILGGEWEEA